MSPFTKWVVCFVHGHVWTKYTQWAMWGNYGGTRRECVCCGRREQWQGFEGTEMASWRKVK